MFILSTFSILVFLIVWLIIYSACKKKTKKKTVSFVLYLVKVTYFSCFFNVPQHNLDAIIIFYVNLTFVWKNIFFERLLSSVPHPNLNTIHHVCLLWQKLHWRVPAISVIGPIYFKGTFNGVSYLSAACWGLKYNRLQYPLFSWLYFLLFRGGQLLNYFHFFLSSVTYNKLWRPL